MSNKHLEELIEARGIKLNSAKADIIRKKCSFLSYISQSDFDFMLNRLESESSNNLTNVKPSPNNPKFNHKTTQPEKELVRYRKAIGYVVKNSPGSNAMMLVANVDPVEENDGEFYYTLVSLDEEIIKARNLNLYQKVIS